MKFLSNIVEKEQIKTFIESNSDKIIDTVKTKFDIEDLYSNVVENMEAFISEDIHEFYNNIKTYASQYTLNFLNEQSIANSKKNLV